MSRMVLTELLGQPCWHVSIGGVTTPSFQLALGEPVPRAQPLANEKQPHVYRKNRGTIQLLVWSPWRLRAAEGFIATSGQDEPEILALSQVAGSHVISAEVIETAHDLRISFSNGLELQVFSVGMPGGPMDGANWELWTPLRYLASGPGAQLTTEPAGVPD